MNNSHSSWYLGKIINAKVFSNVRGGIVIEISTRTFMYAASVSAMVRSSSLRVVRRRSRLSDTRFNFSVSTRMSCWRRVFSSSSCWICLFSSSRLKNSSSIPEEGEPITFENFGNVLLASGGNKSRLLYEHNQQQSGVMVLSHPKLILILPPITIWI